MAAIASWYDNQYSAWNRTRRIHAPTYLARVDTNTSRTAAALRSTDSNGNNGNANDVVINMGELLPPGVADKKENKDTLFGPSIGLVGAAPAWCCEPEEERRTEGGTTGSDAKREKGGISGGADELTPDVVKEWVRRSAESTEPTTTLQALVNLKRPTIRLSPLALPATASASALGPTDSSLSNHNLHTQQHGLEFEFDCDAPRCVISLHVVGVPAHLGIGDDHDHHDYAHSREALTTDAAATDTGDRLHLFEATVDGGFAQKLKLSAGAVLELARLEAAARVYRRARIAADTTKSGASLKPVDGSPEGKAEQGVDGVRADAHARRRLMFFRKKGNSHSNSGGDSAVQSTQAATATAGPALAVVDAESATPRHQQQESGTSLDSGTVGPGSGDNKGEGKTSEEAEDEGVKVAIRLSARDADGRPLRVRNDQVTYLHVVRHGPVPAPIVGSHDSGSEGASAGAAGANPGAATGEAGTGADSEVEDTRPWVVKVVKREARIGPHSFHLHEIYGLTAHSSAAEHVHTIAPATAPPNSTDLTTGAHTYPPTATATTGVAPAVGLAGDADADATAECLVCLSAPREVVLLPCRHLVACRECAVNMVEFGAGGNVVQAEGDTGATGGASGSAAGNGGAAGDANASAGGTEGGANTEASAPAPTPAPPAQTRRKRKAKGWFCPVCRQPYTSLLRITTAPPPSAKAGGVHGSNGGGADEDAKRVSLASSLEPEGEPDHPLADAPVLAHTPGQEMTTTPVVPTSEQDLGTARSGFLRHFTGVTAAANGNTNGNGNAEQMV